MLWSWARGSIYLASFGLCIRTLLGDITVSTIAHVSVQDMLNLGIVIKSERLRDFDPIVRERLSVSGN